MHKYLIHGMKLLSPGIKYMYQIHALVGQLRRFKTWIRNWKMVVGRDLVASLIRGLQRYKNLMMFLRASSKWPSPSEKWTLSVVITLERYWSKSCRGYARVAHWPVVNIGDVQVNTTPKTLQLPHCNLWCLQKCYFLPLGMRDSNENQEAVMNVFFNSQRIFQNKNNI